jgi:hypothetical protein
MDNILKLIVGCLGLIGLIVMVVPNSDPLAATKVEVEGAAPIVAAGAPPPPPTTTAPEAQAEPSEFVVDDFDIDSFGQPMVDPTPPAQRALIAQQQQQQANLNNGQAIAGQGNTGQPQIGGTESTGPAGPPPPPPVSAN